MNEIYSDLCQKLGKPVLVGDTLMTLMNVSIEIDGHDSGTLVCHFSLNPSLIEQSHQLTNQPTNQLENGNR